MQKKVVVFILLMVCLLTGCSNKTKSEPEAVPQSSNYDSALAKGKEAIVDKNMDKAIASFELALEYKEKDKEALLLIKQSKLYEKAIQQKDSEPEKSIKSLEKLISMSDGSNTLKKYAGELKKELLAQIDKIDKPNKKDETKVLWNEAKIKQLDDFMISWGNVMGQNYKRYYPGNENVNYYGIMYPQDLEKDNIAVNEEKVSIELSEDGSGNSDYNIVAIYSDAEGNATMSIHLYFFTFYKGQPMVIGTMQNQGNQENLIYFNETKNEDLKKGFQDIASGQFSEQAEKPKETKNSWAPGVKEKVIQSCKERDYLKDDYVEGTDFYFTEPVDGYSELYGKLDEREEMFYIVNVNIKTGNYHG